jgi:DNA-binding transcriptional MocR family regulator
VHHLGDDSDRLANLWDAADRAGTLDNIWMFASSSKITFAGAGVSWIAGSDSNLQALGKLVGMSIIGFDKVNQLRHSRMFPDIDSLKQHMLKHAAILKPKFDAVSSALNGGLDEDFGSWTSPNGGYFVSFDTQPGLASHVVKMASDAGVTLTPAGATYPYGKDPENSNIRLAPSLPPMEELIPALEVFVCCVKLATVRQKLGLL